jgi:GT2 family glycosyltransferase
MVGELAVVIVIERSATVVEDCLRTAAKALVNIPGARVIVVDTASDSEPVAAVARTAPDAEIITLPANAGFAAAVNAGIAEAPGCDVLVLNPEARLTPETITHLRAALAVPGIGIAVPPACRRGRPPANHAADPRARVARVS